MEKESENLVEENDNISSMKVGKKKHNNEEDKEEAYSLRIRNFSLSYNDGKKYAIKDITLDIEEKKITAFIGPSGCGKTTMLKSINRMNDLIPTVCTTGEIFCRDKGASIVKTKNKNKDKNKTSDILYEAGSDLKNIEFIDPVRLRRKVGMVFQKPNPFPKSIKNNITWAAKIHGYTGDFDELVETSLKKVHLWDEVKDKLGQSAYDLSGGQQQRLCIARAIAISPNILLMDEPTSALDPLSTSKVEELIQELGKDYTIVIVTHNMSQTERISRRLVFFAVDENGTGYLQEKGKTKRLFERARATEHKASEFPLDNYINEIFE